MTEDLAVQAERLRKRYGRVDALAGLDLAVSAGRVCGLLGPNGAGKTTAVRILATLLRFDGGRATVAGFDVASQPAQVRGHIGFTGQQQALDETLTGRQNLTLLGRLHHFGRRSARARAAELLDEFRLSDAADKQVKHYSGGMQRRLDLAANLVNPPRVLFLDEPTTGLDPRSRGEVWDSVRRLVADGTTVLLTTQYLEEADQLAHQVAVIDHGRVIAEGTSDQLKAKVGRDHVEVVVRDAADLPTAADVVARVCATEPDVVPDTRTLRAAAADRVAALTALVRAFDDSGIAVDDIGVRRPTLDDVFLGLTGHRAHAEQEEAA